MAARKDVERGLDCKQDEVQQPKIHAKESIIDGGCKKGKASSKGYPWMIYLSTCVAVCGSYQFGACAGYSSPTQSAITAKLHLSTAEFSLFGSILTFGAMFGAITSGPIADFVGRKWAMGLYATCCVAGWLVIYFSKGTFVLDIGRLAGGYGMGAFSYVVPIYIAEISPVNIRGALTTLNQVMISTGVSVAFIIGIGIMESISINRTNPLCYYDFGFVSYSGVTKMAGKKRKSGVQRCTSKTSRPRCRHNS